MLQTNIITGLNNNIDILANNITIGSINSIINIYGTTNYIFKNSSVYQNKTLVLNYDVNSEQAIDTGTLSGIVIKGIYNDGYIKTSTDASRFLLRTPNDIIDKYIATTDINNNLFISGTTVLNDNVTINSNLFVAGITNIQNMTVRSQLYAANECIINGDTTINSNLFASNIKATNISVLSNLFISNNSIFNNVTMISDLFVSGIAIFQNTTITSNLVGNNAIFNNDSTVIPNRFTNYNISIF